MRNRVLFPIAVSSITLAAWTAVLPAADVTPPLEMALPSPSPKPAPFKVVSSDKLLPFLPTPPEGWTAEAPQGATTDVEEFKLTTAQRDYHRGAEDNAPSASVSIIDFAGNEAYLDATTAVWNVSSDTAEGYDKPVEIDGVRGYEHYDKAAKGSSLSLIIAKRYFVQIELTNQDPKELREWLKKIDLKKLAEIK